MGEGVRRRGPSRLRLVWGDWSGPATCCCTAALHSTPAAAQAALGLVFACYRGDWVCGCWGRTSVPSLCCIQSRAQGGMHKQTAKKPGFLHLPSWCSLWCVTIQFCLCQLIRKGSVTDDCPCCHLTAAPAAAAGGWASATVPKYYNRTPFHRSEPLVPRQPCTISITSFCSALSL